MRLAALVESDDHVCCRYRLAAFRPALMDAGHSLDLLTLPDGWVGRLGIYRTLDSYDAVVLQRKLFAAPELAYLRRHCRALVFDYDDAVWNRDSFAGKGIVCTKRERRFARTVRASDVVVAGNDYLAAAAKKCNGAGDVVVIPTCVNPMRYPVAAHDSPGPRLVWVGSASTLRGLHVGRAMLEAVGKAIPSARLTLVCDQFLRFDPLPVDEVIWAESNETKVIASADIGIAWVPDDAWSRGKCGLKVLQYQAAGLPVVANRVGVHTQMVRDGVTGYLADSVDEWVSAVRVMVNAEFRRRLGMNGRRQVIEKYSTAVGGEMWLEVIGRLAAANRLAG